MVTLIDSPNQNAPTIVPIFGYFTHIMIKRMFRLIQLLLKYFILAISIYRYDVTNS